MQLMRRLNQFCETYVLQLTALIVIGWIIIVSRM